jgi:hypothetical protein
MEIIRKVITGENVKSLAYGFWNKNYAERFFNFVKENRTIDKIFILSELRGKDRIKESIFLNIRSQGNNTQLLTEELVDDLICDKDSINEKNDNDYRDLISDEEKMGVNLVILDRMGWTMIETEYPVMIDEIYMGKMYQVWRRLGVIEEPIP